MTTQQLMRFPSQRHKEALPLHPFQREAFEAVFKARAEGITRQVIAIPTGGGKTVLACHLVAEVGLPTVFMVHRDELVEQTIQKFTLFDPEITLAVCKAERGRYGEELAGRDVVIASAQTLAQEKRLLTLKQAVGPGGFFIADECHHAAAPTWRRAIEQMEPNLLVGLSATPKRSDGQALDSLFQEIVYSVPMAHLVEQRMLARPVGIRIGTEVDLDGVSRRQGDFATGELETAVNTAERNALVVQAWERYAWPERQRTIAFTVDVAHARALAETFRRRGHKAAYVIGETPKDERAELYRDFATGELNVLVSCMVLTEGFDEPKVDCALMCRPTQSQSLYIQMAGRALRRSEGKADALIIDFVDVSSRHNLQTILTLAGKDAEGVKQKADKDKFDLFQEVGEEKERRTRIKAGSERLGDLLGESRFVWQRAGDWSFAPAGNSTWIAIVRQGDDGFIPIQVSDQRGEDPTWRPLFKRPVDVETAMQVAQNLMPETKLTTRDADWRQREEPATPGQIRAATAWRLSLPPGCTKAQAAQILDEHFFKRAMKRSGAAKAGV